MLRPSLAFAAAALSLSSARADAPAPAWDIASPPGDGWNWTEVPIDVDEGTWLSLDVSPDGTTIVFDLLGDLCTIPIAGGDATCITSGIAWDMQPAYSPDGAWIAFTSDRTGANGKAGDNIWVVRADGSEPRQITREAFRLLTQPCWTPDGTGIVARKHFTSRRSIGSGEMWRYHFNAASGFNAAGGAGATDGLQITSRPTDQKDVGEPALSPDGRFLYYSLDATPGQSFEYDKDSTPGIYAIDRLDLERGDNVRLVAGPGGACRPTPSPDGKQLAFVRRVRYQTTLFVMDLASGKARPVFDALERDNQETWAIHGVYPRIDWTPDGRSLVFWAGGKLRRVDVESGKAEIIPFRVKGDRQVAQALRVPIEVAPESFDVRMLRHATVSPAGDHVVFQALGRLHVAALDSGAQGEPVLRGAPRRLTSASDEFEFFPSWSRDGRSIVYVSWNDERFGSVKVVGAEGGAGRPVTTEPGHYVDPVFTPDGARVVYGKVSGGYLTTPLWSLEPGLYVVPTANGAVPDGEKVAPRLVSRRGMQPQFGAGSDRVYLSVREGGKESDNTRLISVPLDGAAIGVPGEERTHLRSDWATDFRVSPDGRHAAFVERFRVYATPLVATGRGIDVGPKANGAPIVQLSEDAGEYLHWSGDGLRVHWSLGPELFTARVDEAMRGFGAAKAPAEATDPEGTKAKPSLPGGPPSSLNLGFRATQDVPRRSSDQRHCVALVNARILTMDDPLEAPFVRGGRIIDEGTVVIVGNRIEAVGPSTEVAIPADAERIDVAGATVMPGLVDVHAHGGQGERGVTPQRNWINWANVAFGVTTIHDPSNDTEEFFAASELARTGGILAPRLFSTGTILYGAASASKAEVDSLEDAIFHLKRMKAVGAFTVKSYNQPRRDQRQMLLEAARQLGMMVVPEGGALFQHNMTMVVDGHTSIEHTLPVERIYDDVCQLWRGSGTGYTPTLGVAYGGLGGENYWYARTNVWEDEHLMRFVPRFVVDPRARRRVDAPDGDWNHVKAAGIAKRLLDAGAMTGGVKDGPGGGPTIGAHGQLAGLAAHWEMWMLVQGGFTPFEALRAATRDGAWYVGLDGDVGSLAPGKLADLVVLEKDPLADIRNSTSIVKVMLNGRLYDARTMCELLPVRGPAPRFFFEELEAGSAVTRSLEAMHELARGCAGCGREACGGEHGEEGLGYR